MSIPLGDKKFLERLLPYFRLKKIETDESDSKQQWPDIWVSFQRYPPIIVVTKEWKKQSYHERRKRLVHEGLHLVGLEHPSGGGVKIGNLYYSTFPKEDSFSKAVYLDILRNSQKWSPRRFGL